MVGGGRGGGERAAGRASVRLSAAGPSAPPSASRPDAAAHGPTRRGWALRPPRPPRAPAPPPPPRRPVGQSVSQSVSHGARGAGAAGAHGVCREGAPRLGRRRRGGGAAAAGGAQVAAAQPVAAAVAGAAGGPSSCRGECSASPSGPAEESGRARGCEALPPLPPPFSRRPAAPSGHGADGRARGGVAAAAAWTWRGEAAGGWVRVGAARPGCTRCPRGLRRRETMRCGAARRGCDWTYPTGTGRWWPGTAGREGLSPH